MVQQMDVAGLSNVTNSLADRRGVRRNARPVAPLSP
jgi:hypothetical protein